MTEAKTKGLCKCLSIYTCLQKGASRTFVNLSMIQIEIEIQIRAEEKLWRVFKGHKTILQQGFLNGV